MSESEAITPEWIARAFDVPPWILGIGDPPPPPTGWRKVRLRTAAHIGQTGWRAGNLAVVLGRRSSRAYALGSRITDVGDWIANRVSGR